MFKMVLIPPELRLDSRASSVPKSIMDILGDVLAIRNATERNRRIENLVTRLEEEMKKIDAFKRELPLCMLLMKEAIVSVKEELLQCEPQKNPNLVLEEFIPMKKDCDGDEEGLKCNKNNEKDCGDKKNWMTSVKIWNSQENAIDVKQNPKSQTKINEKKHSSESEIPFPISGSTSVVVNRAFIPFKPFSGFSEAARREEKDRFSLNGLNLLTPGIKALKDEPVCNGNTSSNTNAPMSLHALTAQQQAARKQRRCWSPELHRRFVGALQQLGGSQVATPKQIRELMQVDGLTNDEVKSHLQKYRLHTRRSPKPSSSQSGSPQGPFQLDANGVADESMEDDEDTKSEGYSWKSQHSRTGIEHRT